MSVVIDASVACKWFFDENDGGKAIRVLQTERPLFAPDLITAEVASVVARYVSAGELDEADSRAHLAGLAKAIEYIVPLGGLAERATTMALSLCHSVYDCFYLALATNKDVPMITADKEFVRRVARSEWKTFIRAL